VHQNKHYYWNDKNLRMRTLKFFTDYLNVADEFYLRNEEAFFMLVHNTYDSSKLTDTSACMEHMPITELFKEVFG
jgi:hypothetical protein